MKVTCCSCQVPAKFSNYAVTLLATKSCKQWNFCPEFNWINFSHLILLTGRYEHNRERLNDKTLWCAKLPLVYVNALKLTKLFYLCSCSKDRVSFWMGYFLHVNLVKSQGHAAYCDSLASISVFSWSLELNERKNDSSKRVRKDWVSEWWSLHCKSFSFTLVL